MNGCKTNQQKDKRWRQEVSGRPLREKKTGGHGERTQADRGADGEADGEQGSADGKKKDARRTAAILRGSVSSRWL